MRILDIISTVADFRGLPKSAISGSSVVRSVAYARQEVCWLARRHTALSFAQIGRHLGHRDHTTVMSAVRVVAARASGDHRYQRDLDQLERLIGVAPAADLPLDTSPLGSARRIVIASESATSADSWRMATGIVTAAAILDQPALSAVEAREAVAQLLSGIRGHGHA